MYACVYLFCSCVHFLHVFAVFVLRTLSLSCDQTIATRKKTSHTTTATTWVRFFLTYFFFCPPFFSWPFPLSLAVQFVRRVMTATGTVYNTVTVAAAVRPCFLGHGREIHSSCDPCCSTDDDGVIRRAVFSCNNNNIFYPYLLRIDEIIIRGLFSFLNDLWPTHYCAHSLFHPRHPFVRETRSRRKNACTYT